MRPPYCRKFEDHWSSFANQHTILKSLDFFVTGYDFYAPIWFPSQVSPLVLRVIGSPEELMHLHGLNLENLDYKENGRFQAKVLEDEALVATLDFFPEMGELINELNQRPFSYQKSAYSFRLSSMLQDAQCGFPREVRCETPLQTHADLAEILRFCLYARLPLSTFTQGKSFAPIEPEHWQSLCMQKLVSSELRSSYLLDDLENLGCLSSQVLQMTEKMRLALVWWEESPAACKDCWQEFLKKQAKRSTESLAATCLKEAFLSLFIDAHQNRDLHSRFPWITEVQSLGPWWSETLSGEPILSTQMPHWKDHFNPHEKEAFLLSGLYSMPQVRNQDFAHQKLQSMLDEFLIEEKVKNSGDRSQNSE